MLVNTQAELMYPALGLGCGDDKDCGCGCKKGDKGYGIGDIGDITDRSKWTLPLCAPFAFDWLRDLAPEFCRTPTTEEILKDKSNCGGLLSAANCKEAEDSARDIVNSDNPCNYSELDGMSEWDKIFKCGQVNWPLVSLVVIGGIILIKKI